LEPEELHVYRRWETNNSVSGEMWWDGARKLYTLEPSRLTPVHPGHPCIPAGRYNITLTRSPHLGYITPLLLAVPGRSEIRIHKANWPTELLGCTAVGLDRDTDKVDESAVAFDRLMRVLLDAEPIWITYHDSQPVQWEMEFADGGRTEQPAETA
jgi:hypothetical protein